MLTLLFSGLPGYWIAAESLIPHLTVYATPAPAVIPLSEFIKGCSSSKGYSIQLFAGPTDEGTSIAASLATDNITPVDLISTGNGRCVVTVGVFTSAMEARAYRDHFRSNGYADCFSLPLSTCPSVSLIELGTSRTVTAALLLEQSTDDVDLLSRHFKLSGNLRTASAMVRDAARKVFEPASSDSRSSSVAEVLKFVRSIPDAMPVKLELAGAIADEEYACSGTATIIPHFERQFIAGTIACYPESYWDHCFRFAQLEHETKKNRSKAILIWDYVLNGSDFNGYRAPIEKRVRALVELAASSREAVGRGIGSYHDIRIWKHIFETEFGPKFRRASATLDIMMMENYWDLHSSVDRKDAQRQCKEFAQAYHLKYSNCHRERSILYWQEIVFRDNPNDIFEIAREARKLGPPTALERDQFGVFSTDRIAELLKNAVSQSVKIGDEKLENEFREYLAAWPSGRLGFTPNQHKVFEIQEP